MYSFEYTIVFLPSFLYWSDVLQKVLGMELACQDPFVVWNEYLIFTGFTTTQACEVLGDIHYIVSMEFVYFYFELFTVWQLW